MPNDDGTLTAQEDAQFDELIARARIWIEHEAERASVPAAASAALLAGFNAYEDAMGTAALADLIDGLSETAQQKLADGPPAHRRH